jgi:hypothetical protein
MKNKNKIKLDFNEILSSDRLKSTELENVISRLADIQTDAVPVAVRDSIPTYFVSLADFETSQSKIDIPEAESGTTRIAENRTVVLRGLLFRTAFLLHHERNAIVQAQPRQTLQLRRLLCRHPHRLAHRRPPPLQN